MGTAAFFLIPPDRARPGGRPWKWFETISANQVSQAKEHLKNAIVIVGQNHSTSEDNHATPLGEMPGALVHANLIASLLHFGTEQKDEEGAKLLVEVSTVFVSATMITGLYWSAVEWLREKQRQPNRGKIWEFVASAFELIWFPVVVIFTALVVAAIDVLVGAKVLLRGVNIGSFVPVFGVILEGLVHIGHIIYGWLHRVASLIIDLTLRVVRKNAAAPVIFACVFCYSILGVVRAEEPIGSVGYLQVEGDKASVVVQRPGEIAPRSGDQVFEVFANDTIWVTNAGTRAWVRFYDVSLRLPEDGIEQGRPQYIVPQIPPPGSANWWYRIWHEHILPPPPSPGVPAHTQASRRNGPGADVPAMAVEHPDQLSPEDWTTATSGHPRHTAASKHRSGASAVGR